MYRTHRALKLLPSCFGRTTTPKQSPGLLLSAGPERGQRPHEPLNSRLGRVISSCGPFVGPFRGDLRWDKAMGEQIAIIKTRNVYWIEPPPGTKIFSSRRV